MRSAFIAVLLACCVHTAAAQTFSDFISLLNRLPEAKRAAAVDSFMNAADRFPYVEFDTLCHFIYRGDASTVGVSGDMNQWGNPSLAMMHVYPTDFWFANGYYEADARLDYKYAVNGELQIDALNPYQMPGGLGTNSELRMPAYVFPEEVDYISSNPGAVSSHSLASDTLTYGNPRSYKIYLPANYDTTGATRYPLAIVHDGNDYLNLARMSHVLDYLIDNQRIEPVIGLFVSPAASGNIREQEYGTTHRDEYIYFVAEELIPHVDSTWATDPRPERRATIGDSYGGNISLQLAAEHPELIGHAAGQSPFVSSEVQELLDVPQGLPLDIWVDIGTYDISLLETQVNCILMPILENRNYDFALQTMHEGHSWGSWRKNLQPILTRFFPDTASSSAEPRRSELPRDCELLPNRPNPFNGTTLLSFRLDKQGWTRLSVFDMLGREVVVVSEGMLGPGHYEVAFNSGRIASGTYITRLETNERADARRITVVK